MSTFYNCKVCGRLLITDPNGNPVTCTCEQKKESV